MKNTTAFNLVSDFLNGGATLSDTQILIEMLKEYKEEIETGIAEWRDLLPEVEAPIVSRIDFGNTHHFDTAGSEWGDKTRRKQLNGIIGYLRRTGFVPNGGVLGADRESCTWTIIKGEGRGTLSWTPDTGYILTGLSAAHNSDQYEIPVYLTWQQ